MMDIELLSPAGDMDSLVAAVECGADAVYLGGKSFSARQYAGNFDRDELKKAVEYCHIRGVKVYVTVNTLIKDIEMGDVPEYITYLYNVGTDALIIQDVGMGKLIRDIIPDFELHASTQMTAHNLESVNLLYDLGYRRVVLSRELSFDEIEHICSNTKAEIEVFAHGALCICYSGQCLMSSMIGGRSGNRGRCAQPCRQRYKLIDGGFEVGEKYILSPKDLSTIEHMDSMIKSGVKSLKIEGRMKKPEYVAAVTSVYRKALDNYMKFGSADISEEDKKELLKIFNRGGFTTAHLLGKGGSEMMSFERPKNWGIFVGSITGVYQKNGKVELSLEDELSKGDGIEIWTREGSNIGYTVEHVAVGGKLIDKALKGDKALINYKGGKKGDMVYKTFDIELNKKLQSAYKGSDPKRKVPVKCEAVVKMGVPSCILLEDDRGRRITVEGNVPEDAIKVALSKERLIDQLSKFGGTPFHLESIDVILDDGISLSARSINSMRREAVLRLIDERVKDSIPEVIDFEVVKSRADEAMPDRNVIKKDDVRVSVLLKDSSLVESAIDGGADIIIFGGDKLRGYDYDYNSAIEKCKARGVEVYISSPRIIRSEFYGIIDVLNRALDAGADGVYADNLGIMRYISDKGMPFSAGFSLNIFNLVSASMFMNMGSRFVSISPELSIGEIRKIAPYIANCEVLCYGRVEMMVSEYCPVGAGGDKKCKVKNSLPLCEDRAVSIKDRLGMEFPIKTDYFCRSHIYNSRILSMLEGVGELVESGVNILRVNILDEGPEEVLNIVKGFKDSLISLKEGTPLPKSVDDAVLYIKNKGYTKGHYYRGVE